MSYDRDHWQTHWDAGHNWALVLAAGEGSRLQALTTIASGVAVPKQFCSFGGGTSLLHDAMARARVVAEPERITTVVADHHHRWWRELRLDLSPENLVKQPRNRGTAIGILLPLLHILRRDPDASVLVLPSDHYVRNEDVLASSLRRAMVEVAHRPEHILLLGVAPDEADSELGYIVSEGDPAGDVRTVTQFVEKPDAATARALIARGGVWNSFIFAAKGHALLRAFEARCPDLVGEMRHLISLPASPMQRMALLDLYQRSPDLDFSREILQRSPARLRVMTIPACGWSDLGTPHRVIEAGARLRSMLSGASAVAEQTLSLIHI